MNRSPKLVRTIRLFLSSGLTKRLALQLWHRLFDSACTVILLREINSRRSLHAAPCSFRVRLMSERERSLLLSVASDESQPASERCDAARLLTMMMNDVKTCYVVEDCAGNARFLQWLILPDGNDHLHRRFRDWYPVLHFDEALMEFAYVFPKYRGTGVLPYAVELILEKAPRDVIKNIITLIPTHNRNSLRSFINMGFVPQQVRIDTRRFGIPHRSIFSLQSPDQVSALRQRLPESVMHILMKCAVERSNSEAAVTETQFN